MGGYYEYHLDPFNIDYTYQNGEYTLGWITITVIIEGAGQHRRKMYCWELERRKARRKLHMSVGKFIQISCIIFSIYSRNPVKMITNET